MGRKLNNQNVFFFFMIFALVLVMSYTVISPFLGAIVVGILIVLLFHPLYRLILKVLKSEPLSSMATTLVVVLAVIVPIILVSIITVNQVNTLVQDAANYFGIEIQLENFDTNNTDQINNENELIINNKNSQQFDFESVVNDLNTRLEGLNIPLNITSDELQTQIQNSITPVLQFILNTVLGIASNLPMMFTQLIVFLAVVTSLFPNIHKVRRFISKVSPLEDEIDILYLKKLQAMGVSMIRGTFVVAFVQAFLSAILLSVMGVNYVFFWALLVFFFSIIPVGGGIILFPIGLFMVLTGQVVEGIIIILLGFLIVSFVDSLIRPYLVSKEAYLPPAVVLIGVLGGIQIFGLIGFIYGPMIMIFLYTTLEVYLHNYKELQA